MTITSLNYGEKFIIMEVETKVTRRDWLTLSMLTFATVAGR